MNTELKNDKTKALKDAKGNYDANTKIARGARTELHWWVLNTENLFQKYSGRNTSTQLLLMLSSQGGRHGIKEYSQVVHGKIRVYKQYWLFRNVSYLTRSTELCKAYWDHAHRILYDNPTAVNIINHKGTPHSDINNTMQKRFGNCVQIETSGLVLLSS